MVLSGGGRVSEMAGWYGYPRRPGKPCHRADKSGPEFVDGCSIGPFLPWTLPVPLVLPPRWTSFFQQTRSPFLSVMPVLQVRSPSGGDGLCPGGRAYVASPNAYGCCMQIPPEAGVRPSCLAFHW